LLLSVVVSLLFIKFYDMDKILGDEPAYIKTTHLESAKQISPVVSLVPGFLRFE